MVERARRVREAVAIAAVEVTSAGATMSTVLQIAAHVASDNWTWRPPAAAAGTTVLKDMTTPSTGRSTEEIDTILDRSV